MKFNRVSSYVSEQAASPGLLVSNKSVTEHGKISLIINCLMQVTNIWPIMKNPTTREEPEISVLHLRKFFLQLKK